MNDATQTLGEDIGSAKAGKTAVLLTHWETHKLPSMKIVVTAILRPLKINSY